LAAINENLHAKVSSLQDLVEILKKDLEKSKKDMEEVQVKETSLNVEGRD